MQKGILTQAVTNTVLDKTIPLAPAGATVRILSDNGDHYEVIYEFGESPTATFYVDKNQIEVVND